MMKLGTLLLMLVLLPVGVDAVDFGVVSSSDYLRFPVIAVDSAGIEQIPDSGHVLVWFEGEGSANAASFSDRWTTAGANGSYIDSVRYASHNYYYFVDQVADLDNDEGNGVYTGVVVLFTDGEPYPNRFAFTLAGDELADYWAEVTRVGDSIDAFDGWIGQQSEIANLNGWNPSNDEVLADLTSISGDATAADNLETMVDGTGGQKLTLGGLHIRAAGNDTAVTTVARCRPLCRSTRVWNSSWMSAMWIMRSLSSSSSMKSRSTGSTWSERTLRMSAFFSWVGTCGLCMKTRKPGKPASAKRVRCKRTRF